MNFNFRIKHHCPESRCQRERPFRMRRDLTYDPVVEHIIQLRGYLEVLEEHFEEGCDFKFPPANAETVRDERGRHKPKSILVRPVNTISTLKRAKNEPINTTKRKPKKKVRFAMDTRLYELPPIPEFPAHYPFKNTFYEKFKNHPEVRVKVVGQITAEECQEGRIYFVKRIIALTGFELEEQTVEIEDCTFPVRVLQSVLHAFLVRFMKVLRQNKLNPAMKDKKNLWSPFENTLHELGFLGVAGLHKYYREEVVMKHDILMNKVLELRHFYELLHQNRLILEPDKTYK